MNRRTCISLLLTLGAPLACRAPAASARSYSAQRIERVDWEQVYRAAEATMAEYFRIENADPRTGIIRSVPTETSSAPALQLGQALSTPPTVRRIAELQLQQHDGAIRVLCGVTIQRLERADTLSYVQRTSITDAPNQTPLRESQGLAADGQGVWTIAGYDRRLQNQMLAGLVERVSTRNED